MIVYFKIIRRHITRHIALNDLNNFGEISCKNCFSHVWQLLVVRLYGVPFDLTFLAFFNNSRGEVSDVPKYRSMALSNTWVSTFSVREASRRPVTLTWPASNSWWYYSHHFLRQTYQKWWQTSSCPNPLFVMRNSLLLSFRRILQDNLAHSLVEPFGFGCQDFYFDVIFIQKQIEIKFWLSTNSR